MNAGTFAPLIADFAQNWADQQPDFVVSVVGTEVEVEEEHPLYVELVSLCSGRSASLPFIAKANEVVWCTMAPSNELLRPEIAALHAWVIPSFAGTGLEDGHVQPQAAKGGLVTKIISVSPDGYYRWRCPRAKLPLILEKLRLRRSLEAIRPTRTRPPRPSLYELRARFVAALLVGDRDGAGEIVLLLDSLQLETAVNTQFMRIRLWHHFREHERIRANSNLQHLLAQPLPPNVRAWINEALGVETGETAGEATTSAIIRTSEPPAVLAESTWADWFNNLRTGDRTAAELFLTEHRRRSPDELKPAEISALVTAIEDLFLDDALRERERDLIAPGVAEFLEEFVRESEFPRSDFGDLYLALLRVWSALHAGNSSGQQHGHVLLELASAALQLNRAPGEVLKTVEHWWEARPARSQLPFALDAIELLERELPNPEAPANLWLAAADLILRSPDALLFSEKTLWRRVGTRLGLDDATIGQYLLSDEGDAAQADPLADGKLRHVAVVCMREPQAREAATQIAARSGAHVTLVTNKAAGSETDHARTAEVVLFVWMASTHAVFRAFDGYDRKRLCYVQGTGASSIVRTLERWVSSQSVIPGVERLVRSH